MLVQLGAADGGADSETPGLLADFAHTVDTLDVDDEVGLQPAGAQLHQQVGATRQDLGGAAFARQQADSGLKGCRRFVTHVSSRSQLPQKRPVLGVPGPARSRGQYCLMTI